MLKKTLKYTDLDGNPAEEVAYFNLTKAEAIELNIRNDLEVIGNSRDQNLIMDTFKRILEMSYGERNAAGKFSHKGFPEFAASEAYSELFMEIWQNPEYAQEFVLGILPPNIADPAEVQQSQSNIPAHLADHPSMQSHRAPQQHAPRREEPKSPTPTDVGPDYSEFLAWKSAQAGHTPPERVSPPEAPQQALFPREDLI